MKPFNLKDALAGKPCFSKDRGNVIDIVRLEKSTDDDCKIAVTFESGHVNMYSESGRYIESSPSSIRDLQMTTTLKKGFINVYPSSRIGGSMFTVGECEAVYDTHDNARHYGLNRYKTENFLTIPIEFEF